MNVKLFFRGFADCENDSSADELLERLQAALSRWNPVMASHPERYWKIPKWYEFTFNLQLASADSFDEIVGSVAGGWTDIPRNECSSVWNRADGLVLLIPELAWASFERVD